MKSNPEREGILRVIIATPLSDRANERFDQLEFLRSKYFSEFQRSFPKVKIEFIPYFGQASELGSFAKTLVIPADLILMNKLGFESLIFENQLIDLNTNIKNDDFDIENLTNAMVNPIKEIGSGQLFALSPQFSVDVMVYNKQLLDNLGLEYPRDRTTWEDWIRFSKRIPHQNGIIAGISIGNGGRFDSLRYYSSQADLQIFDMETFTMSVDSEDWINAWDKFVQWDHENVFPKIGADYPSAPYALEPIMGRRVAASTMNLEQLVNLMDANQRPEQFKENPNYDPYVPIDWDIVSMPVISSETDRGSEIIFEGLMGVSTRSAQSDLAWEVIKYVNSAEWAQIHSQNIRWVLSRKDQMDRNLWMNKNIDAFYAITPSSVNYKEHYEQMDKDFRYIDLLGTADELMNESLAGRITGEKAMKIWSEKGNFILKSMKENPTPVKSPYSSAW